MHEQYSFPQTPRRKDRFYRKVGDTTLPGRTKLRCKNLRGGKGKKKRLNNESLCVKENAFCMSLTRALIAFCQMWNTVEEKHGGAETGAMRTHTLSLSLPPAERELFRVWEVPHDVTARA